MKGISIKRFGYYLLYLLSIHAVALFFFFVFRFTLFCSIEYQFPADIAGDTALKAVAFVRGLWFDNVIACYLLLLPLVVAWIAALFNYTAKCLFRSMAGYFVLLYAVSMLQCTEYLVKEHKTIDRSIAK